MKKLKERFKEPSTHAGLAAIVAGFGMIFKSQETQAVANVIPDVAEKLSTNDYLGAIMVGFGAVAVFLREGKNGNGS